MTLGALSWLELLSSSPYHKKAKWTIECKHLFQQFEHIVELSSLVFLIIVIFLNQ